MNSTQRTHLRQLERLTWIHREIQAGRFPNTRRIAEHFGVSRKTAQETIDFMRNRFKLPMEYCAQRRGFHYTEPVHSLPWMTLTEGEIAAILMAERLAQAYGGQAAAGITEALTKVIQTLTETVSVDLNHLMALQSVEALPTSPIDQAHFALFAKAIAHRHPVRMVYFTQSSGETKTRTVNPLRLHSAKAEWYVIAFDHLRQKVLDFHLGRVRAAELLDETFEPPTGFDIETYLNRGFGMIRGEDQTYEVIVEFDAYQARWIRQQSKVHKTAHYTDLPDGGLRVTMQVGALEGVRQWVLQYGARVRVIAPEQLRTMLRTEAEALLKLYV
jgi:predicted DNA-binding transcriptional regulator YafY